MSVSAPATCAHRVVGGAHGLSLFALEHFHSKKGGLRLFPVITVIKQNDNFRGHEHVSGFINLAPLLRRHRSVNCIAGACVSSSFWWKDSRVASGSV